MIIIKYITKFITKQLKFKLPQQRIEFYNTNTKQYKRQQWKFEVKKITCI